MIPMQQEHNIKSTSQEALIVKRYRNATPEEQFQMIHGVDDIHKRKNNDCIYLFSGGTVKKFIPTPQQWELLDALFYASERKTLTKAEFSALLSQYKSSVPLE